METNNHLLSNSIWPHAYCFCSIFWNACYFGIFAVQVQYISQIWAKCNVLNLFPFTLKVVLEVRYILYETFTHFRTEVCKLRTQIICSTLCLKIFLSKLNHSLPTSFKTHSFCVALEKLSLVLHSLTHLPIPTRLNKILLLTCVAYCNY